MTMTMIAGLAIVLVVVVGGLIVRAVWLAVETWRLKREVLKQRARLVAKINAVFADQSPVPPVWISGQGEVHEQVPPSSPASSPPA